MPSVSQATDVIGPSRPILGRLIVTGPRRGPRAILRAVPDPGAPTFEAAAPRPVPA